MSFKFDERALRQAVEREAQSALAQTARDFEHELDQLRIRYAGRPVSQIRPAVRQVFARRGGSISEPELTEYADAVRAGIKIHVNVGKFRL